jgi:hypothetical protein
MENYIRCYLSDNPEAAIRKQLAVQPEVATRAVQYLQHREVQRILQITDPAERVERLLPYFANRTVGRTAYEAQQGIVAAGSVAGPYLLGLYQSAANPSLRHDIVHTWASIRWSGCVDLLIAQLKEDDKFWANQKLEPGWWNKDTESWLTKRRREVYGEIYTSVYALSQIGEPRAGEAIELTRRRWAAIAFENPQIIEECDRALKRFAQIEEQKSRSS